MPEGPLFASAGDFFGSGGGDPGASDETNYESGVESESGDGGDDTISPQVESSKSEFVDGDTTAVVRCQPSGGGGGAKKAPPANCTFATIKGNLDSCDGGTNAWANAKTAAGKNPTVNIAKTQSGQAAETSGSTITIAPTTDCCDATESLLFELHNVESQPTFDKIDADAAKGVYGREDYTKANEREEYNGLKRSWETFDKCKSKWGCGAGAKSFADSFRKAKNFDDYYNNYLGKDHKDWYRSTWDKNYKAAYDAKHKKGP